MKVHQKDIHQDVVRHGWELALGYAGISQEEVEFSRDFRKSENAESFSEGFDTGYQYAISRLFPVVKRKQDLVPCELYWVFAKFGPYKRDPMWLEMYFCPWDKVFKFAEDTGAYERRTWKECDVVLKSGFHPYTFFEVGK